GTAHLLREGRAGAESLANSTRARGPGRISSRANGGDAMTGEQWLGCTEPILMLEFLGDSGVAATARKLRLFAAACGGRVWPLLAPDAGAVVEMSERFADGLTGEAELKAAVWANCCPNSDVRAAVDSAAVGAWRPAVTLLAGLGGPPPGSARA